MSGRPKLYSGTACDQCFRCKVRCAGERPQCGRCRNLGSYCTYSTSKIHKKNRSKGRQSSATSEQTSSSSPPQNTPIPYQTAHYTQSTPVDSLSTPVDLNWQYAPLNHSQYTQSPSEPGSALSPHFASPSNVTATQPYSSFAPPASLDTFVPFQTFTSTAEGHSSYTSYLPEHEYNPTKFDINCASNFASIQNVKDRTSNQEGGSQMREIINTLCELQLYSSKPTLDDKMQHARRSLRFVMARLLQGDTAKSNHISAAQSALSSTLVLACICIVQLVHACYTDVQREMKPARIGLGMGTAAVTRDTFTSEFNVSATDAQGQAVSEQVLRAEMQLCTRLTTHLRTMVNNFELSGVDDSKVLDSFISPLEVRLGLDII